MLEMNPEIREQWCSALRSGEYEQTQNNLRARNEAGTYDYCCLGVLTDLYVKAGNPENYRVSDESFDVWEAGVLPEPVMEWAGLGGCNPFLRDGLGTGHAAAEWNDNYEADFDMIADMIDGGQS